MKLRLLLLALYAVMGLNGAQSQPASEPITTLEKMLRLTERNGLVVFSHDVKPIEEKDRKIVQKFRQDENRPIRDYIVMNQKMYEGINGGTWVQYGRNIDAIVNADLYNAKCARGLVLYYAMPEDKKSVEEYTAEIKTLRSNGWQVVVNVYNMRSVAEDIFEKDLMCGGKVFMDACSLWTVLKNIMIVGGMVVAVVVLYYKLGALKHKCRGYLFGK